MLLRSAVGMAAPQATIPALGAAELVGAALEAFAADPELLAAERSRVRLLLVDDAQNLDPQAALLVRVLAAGAELAVSPVIPISRSSGIAGPTRRCSATATTRPSSSPRRTGARRPWRGPSPPSPVGCPGRRRQAARRRAGSAGIGGGADRGHRTRAEAAVVADALRRAHLVDGVPWPQMAVLVRSVPRAGAALARALTAAGVPVEQQSITGPLAEQPAVAALLTVLDVVADGLDGRRALSLLTGPIGRVDPVSLRQLRRALRRADAASPPREFAELLVDALDASARPVGDVPDPLARRAACASARWWPRRAAATPTAWIPGSRCGRRGTRVGCSGAG